MTNPSQRMSLVFTDESLEGLVEQVAAIVLERLPKQERTSCYMTTAEAADYLRAKPQRVHDLLSAGKLTRYKDGARTLVARAEVAALVNVARR